MSITLINIENQSATDLSHDAARPVAKAGVWLDVSAPDDADLDWLARTYKFHPLAIEDCRNFNQRAKVEAYDGYLFMSLISTTRARDGVQARELEIFLGPDYLITVHREPLNAIDVTRARMGAVTEVKGQPDFLLWLIADNIVDGYFPLLDEMEDAIDDLEDEILENASQATLQQIYSLKRQLVSLRKVIGPMRDVMNALAGTRFDLIHPHTALYFRDAYDHLTRIYDLIETSRDLLGNALDAHLSTVSNRLGEIVKRLTLLSTIFLPLSFLVGFGGMNFKLLPFDETWSFALMLLLLIITPIVMIIWFRRSKWV